MKKNKVLSISIGVVVLIVVICLFVFSDKLGLDTSDRNPLTEKQIEKIRADAGEETPGQRINPWDAEKLQNQDDGDAAQPLTDDQLKALLDQNK